MKFKGFTLFEVMVATSITSVLGILLLLIMANSTGVNYTESSKIQQGIGINDGLTKIREQIKESAGIASNYPETGTPEFISNSGTLILKKNSIDAQGNLLNNTFDYFIFLKDQDKLRFKIYPDISSSRKSINQILAGNVLSLSFNYLNNQSPPLEVSPNTALRVKVTVSLQEKSGTSYQSSVATTEANLRND